MRCRLITHAVMVAAALVIAEATLAIARSNGQGSTENASWQSGLIPVHIALASVRISLPESQEYVHEEKEDYGISRYLSDVGGAMGLVLGVSLVSFLELVECFIFGTQAVWQYRNKLASKFRYHFIAAATMPGIRPSMLGMSIVTRCNKQ